MVLPGIDKRLAGCKLPNPMRLMILELLLLALCFLHLILFELLIHHLDEVAARTWFRHVNKSNFRRIIFIMIE